MATLSVSSRKCTQQILGFSIIEIDYLEAQAKCQDWHEELLYSNFVYKLMQFGQLRTAWNAGKGSQEHIYMIEYASRSLLKLMINLTLEGNIP